MLRVDHAGEYGATRIYQGQLDVLGRSRGAGEIRRMAETEKRHLARFEELLHERRVRPTLLHPLWSVAGYALGAATALLGERAAMACTVAVEEVIDEHYRGQAEYLGRGGSRTARDDPVLSRRRNRPPRDRDRQWCRGYARLRPDRRRGQGRLADRDLALHPLLSRYRYGIVFAGPWRAVARGLVLRDAEPASAAPGDAGESDAWRTDPDRPRHGRCAVRVARPLPASRDAAQRRPFRRARDRMLLSRLALRHRRAVAPRSRRWCRARPSLPSAIRVRSYPVREVQGNVWVFFGDDPAAAPEIPLLDGFDERPPDLVESVGFAAAIDHAVVGLMDPAHGPFVHRAWWWRSRRSIQQKSKAFAPSPYGFTMSRHAPRANSRAYRLLGGAPETEIVFRLPSVRIEQIRAGRHRVGNLTAITPIDARRDRDQPLCLLDGALAHRAKAVSAALRARLPAPGPRRSWSASSKGCATTRR